MVPHAVTQLSVHCTRVRYALWHARIPAEVDVGHQCVSWPSPLAYTFVRFSAFLAWDCESPVLCAPSAPLRHVLAMCIPGFQRGPGAGCGPLPSHCRGQTPHSVAICMALDSSSVISVVQSGCEETWMSHRQHLILCKESPSTLRPALHGGRLGTEAPAVYISKSWDTAGNHLHWLLGQPKGQRLLRCLPGTCLPPAKRLRPRPPLPPPHAVCAPAEGVMSSTLSRTSRNPLFYLRPKLSVLSFNAGGYVAEPGVRRATSCPPTQMMCLVSPWHQAHLLHGPFPHVLQPLSCTQRLPSITCGLFPKRPSGA